MEFAEERSGSDDDHPDAAPVEFAEEQPDSADSDDVHPDAAPAEFSAPGPVDPSAVETMPFHFDDVAFSFSDAEDEQPERRGGAAG